MRTATDITDHSLIDRIDVPLRLRVVDAVLAAFIVSGCMLSMQGVLGLDAAMASGCVASVVVIFLLELSAPKGRLRTVFLIAALVSALLVALSDITSLQRGILTFANGYIDAWNNLTYSINDTFVVTASLPDMIRVSLIIGIVSAALLASAVRRGSTLEIDIIALLFTVVGLFACTARPVAIGILFVGWLLLRVRCQGGITAFTKSTVGLFIAVLLIVSVAGLFTTGYTGSALVHGARQTVDEGIDHARFGQDNLPQGDLLSGQNMLKGEKTDRLVVDFGEADVAPLYLRGYSGANYSDDAWRELDLSSYEGEWDGLLAWMRSKGVDPLSQYADYAQLDEEESQAVHESYDVSVENLSAYRKYAYMPYSTMGAASSTVNSYSWLDRFSLFDMPFGANSYSFTNVRNDQVTEQSVAGTWTSGDADEKSADYLSASRAYQSFVEQNYTSIDDEELADVVHRFFFAGDEGEAASREDAGLYTVTTRIRTMLAASCDYSASPDAIRTDTDAVEWFLKGGGSGNSTLYASAAVLAFRDAGIPARYTEGYVLNSSDAARAQSAGEHSVTLDSNDAHAWVEVYVKGMGWMPIEVTPGFYHQTVSADQTIDVPQKVPGGGASNDALGTYNPVEEEADADDEKASPGAILSLIAAVILLIASILFALAELQRFIRMRLRRERLCNVDGILFARLAYDHFEKLMQEAGIEMEHSRPLDSLEALTARFEGTTDVEHKRMVGMMEKAVFGGCAVSVSQRRALFGYIDKLECAVADQPRALVALKNRYILLFGCFGGKPIK